MKVRTSSLLQAVWFVSIGAIALVSLLPRVSSVLAPLVDRGWAHFLVYGWAATLCMLAWKGKVALPLAGGLFLFSIALHLLHNFRTGIGGDGFAIAVNLFGTLAGILLGLNLATLRSRLKNRASANGF